MLGCIMLQKILLVIFIMSENDTLGHSWCSKD